MLQPGAISPPALTQAWPVPAAMDKPFPPEQVRRPNAGCSEMLLCCHVPGRHLGLMWKGKMEQEDGGMGDGLQELPKVLQESGGPNRGLFPVTGRAQSFHSPHATSGLGSNAPEQPWGAGSQEATARFAGDPLLLKSCQDASIAQTNTLGFGLAWQLLFCWFIN